MLRIISAALALALGCSAASAANQAPWTQPISGPMSATEFARDHLNPGMLAIGTCNWGPSPPANGPSSAATFGQCWMDTSAAPGNVMRFYDGASWVAVGVLNGSTHTFSPGGLGPDGYSLQGNGSASASYRGFVGHGLGGITRTWQSKAADLINIGDYGAVCDGVVDDTDSIQKAWNEGGSRGLNVNLGGVGPICKISQLVMPTPISSGTGPGSTHNVSVLVGPGSTAVKLMSTVTGSSCAIIASATFGINSYLETRFSGFALEQISLAGTGRGICFNGITSGGIRDVTIRYFDRGFSGTDTILIGIEASTINLNVIGVYGIPDSSSPPNAWNIWAAHFVNNQQHAIFFIQPSGITISGATEFESNGTNISLDPATISVLGQAPSPGVNLNITNAYFEGNSGDADLRIDQNGSTGRVGIFNVKGSKFARSVVTQTSAVRIRNSGSAGELTRVNVGGSSFFDALASPSGFSWLATTTPSTQNYTFNCLETNTVDIPAEMPAACQPPGPGAIPYIDGANQYVGYLPIVSSSIAFLTNQGPGVSATWSNMTSGMLAFMATPSGANLFSALTTKTGTGQPVFGTSPNITTPTGIVKGDVGLGNVPNVDTSDAGNISSGTLPVGRLPALGGDLSTSPGSATTVFNSVNGTPGSFGSATSCVSITVNAKGLVTAISAATCAPAIGSITGIAANCATWLATSSSANLRACITDETGTGAAVFADSPALLGTPTAPTAAVDTNTPQVATTAMVLGQAASATPLIDGTGAPGISTRFARADHVHPTDTSRAPITSPALLGTPTAPSPSALDNSTKIATTLYVDRTTREKLVAARTYYVRTDGSNSNTGLVDSAGGAFLTIQKAVDTVATLDIGTNAVTISVSLAGTYTGTVVVNGPWLGSGTVTLQGNTVTPSNVLISVTSASAVTVQGGAQLTVKGVKLACTGSFNAALKATIGSMINFDAIDFGACDRQIQAGGGAVNMVGTAYTISGGGSYHWFSSAGGSIAIEGVTVTITGTPAFSGAFANCSNLGVCFVDSNTFSGSATGSRYSATGNGVVGTFGGGATYLPGNAAGSTATGGQYL